MLPHDISIYELIPVEQYHNAQHNVDFRTYTYKLHIRKIPSISETSAYYNVENLDLTNINRALQILKKTKDYRSLCKNPDLYKHTICKIEHVEFIKTGSYSYKFEIKSDRFLRGMIRYIVARLIDIGTGKLSLETFDTTLSSLSEFTFKFQNQGYPQGLYLSKVEYPFLTRD